MKIQALDLSVDLLRVMLWQYNDAARLQSLVSSKQAWYDAAQEGFWSDWITDVFDLTTANDFGLSVWAVILNVPLVVAGSSDATDKPIWGFGTDRQGFTQGNFATAAVKAGLTTEQQRLLLRLRYFQLVTRGAIPEINAFLKLIFGNVGGPALAPGLYPQYDATQVARTLRLTTATYYDAAGVLQTAAANVPRFTFDPATHAAQGLLVEAAATNLWLWSSAFSNAVWLRTASVATDNATVSPSGAADGASLVASAAFCQQYQAAFAVNAGDLWTTSVFVKYRDQQYFTLVQEGWTVGTTRATFDLMAGNVFALQGPVTASIQAVGGGWFRVSATFTVPVGNATHQPKLWVGQYNGTNYAPTGVYVWNGQPENAAAPSSPIPTTTAAVTRAADEVHISDPTTPGKVYVADSDQMATAYVFAAGVLTSAIESVLTDFDILPRPAGVKTHIVVQGDADGWGCGRYRENFNNGNFYHL